MIRVFCNVSLRAAGNSLFTAFSPGVDFFKVSFFLYVFMSFFDVFSGAPYGSDFLILTKEIIKKVPKRSAKK